VAENKPMAGQHDRLKSPVSSDARRTRGYVTPADGKVRWGREYLITLATRA